MFFRSMEDMRRQLQDTGLSDPEDNHSYLKYVFSDKEAHDLPALVEFCRVRSWRGRGEGSRAVWCGQLLSGAWVMLLYPPTHTSLDRAERSWVAAAEQILQRAHLLSTD